MPHLNRWFLVEIMTFYGSIIAAVCFLAISYLFKKQTNDNIKHIKQDFDFLQLSEDDYYYFGLFAPQIILSMQVFY